MPTDTEVEVTGTITRVERLESSYYGNPRFAVTIRVARNVECTYWTQVDGSVGYEVTNFKHRPVTLTLRGKRETIVAMRYA
jgi:hypothetical protein